MSPKKENIFKVKESNASNEENEPSDEDIEEQNPKKDKEKEKKLKAQEKIKKEELQKKIDALTANWNKRIELLKQIYPDASGKIEKDLGGLMGEMMSTMRLQPEVIATKIAVTLFLDSLNLAFEILYSLIALASFNTFDLTQPGRQFATASKQKLNYDGTQPIYPLNDEGKPDFTKDPIDPKDKGPNKVSITRDLIWANGYAPAPRFLEGLDRQCVKLEEDMMGNDWLTPAQKKLLCRFPQESMEKAKKERPDDVKDRELMNRMKRK